MIRLIFQIHDWGIDFPGVFVIRGFLRWFRVENPIKIYRWFLGVPWGTPISGNLHIYWLVVWNIFYCSIYWEVHHPNWLLHIFQRGRAKNHQADKNSTSELGLWSLPGVGMWSAICQSQEVPCTRWVVSVISARPAGRQQIGEVNSKGTEKLDFFR